MYKPMSVDLGLEVRALADLEFIYVGDPLCSWCWGFSPALPIDLHPDDAGTIVELTLEAWQPMIESMTRLDVIAER